MKRLAFIGVVSGIALALNRPAQAFLSEFDKGVEAYKEKQWVDAMGAFVNVLHDDPQNALAHRYMDAIAQEISAERRAYAQQQRLVYLQGAAEALNGSAAQSGEVKTALHALVGSDDQQKQNRLREKLEEARMHKELGQLLPANDLIFQILAENADNADAQRELSDLQSRLRQAIDSGSMLALDERYAYEGFYAYGQADYAGAAAAWTKSRAIVDQSTTPTERTKRLAALRFDPYQKVAQGHVDEEKTQNDLRTLFAQGQSAYDQERFEEALETFRKLALRDPEYPQLAFYLVQAETGAEKMRSKRLGEEKRQEIVALYEQGVNQLEKEQFDEAVKSFDRVMALDPTHSQARAYLAMAKAENQRRHDPKAAQMHYETGLIAYASGKLDEAAREWRMATRMNPNHAKAKVALAKVEKELAFYKEVPDAQ